MTHFDKNKLNIDVIVEEVKLKERILIFLNEKGFITDLERNCFGFYQKIQSQNRQKDNCDPLFTNLSLKFGDLEDGKLRLSDAEDQQMKNESSNSGSPLSDHKGNKAVSVSG
jgi:ribosomal protein S8